MDVDPNDVPNYLAKVEAAVDQEDDWSDVAILSTVSMRMLRPLPYRTASGCQHLRNSAAWFILLCLTARLLT